MNQPNTKDSVKRGYTDERSCEEGAVRKLLSYISLHPLLSHTPGGSPLCIVSFCIPQRLACQQYDPESPSFITPSRRLFLLTAKVPSSKFSSMPTVSRDWQPSIPSQATSNCLLSSQLVQLILPGTVTYSHACTLPLPHSSVLAAKKSSNNELAKKKENPLLAYLFGSRFGNEFWSIIKFECNTSFLLFLSLTLVVARLKTTMDPSEEPPKRQHEDKPAEESFSVEDTETVVKTAVNSVLAGTDYKP